MRKIIKIQSLIILFVLIFNIIFPICSIAIESTNMIYISNETELCKLAERVNGGENLRNYTIELTNDISLNCSESKSWIPIGTEDNPFRGIFDGKNYKIMGMEIYEQDGDKGLFGCVENGTIRNVMVSNSIIQIQNNEKSSYIGMIVGMLSSSKIENCSTNNSQIKLTGGNLEVDIGGLVRGGFF